jgi:tetratricopeptide (TPR) repeat protein
MKAAGKDAFWTFVVDQTGRIAYMGHPMFLDLVLTKVIAGDVSAKAVGEEMTKVVAEYETMFENLGREFKADRDLKPALRALKEFEAEYPPLADLLPVTQARLSLLPKHGNPGEGQEYAEALVAKAIKQKDVRVLGLAYSILRDQKESKELLALAMKAAEAHVRIDGGKDAQSLLNLGEAYLVSGDKAKAKEYTRRAIEAAANESADVRQEIEKEVRRLGSEK